MLRWLEHLARRRMPVDDQRCQNAFRRDIDRRWSPTTVGERRLALRSRLTHLATSLFGGGVTLAEVGLSGVATDQLFKKRQSTQIFTVHSKSRPTT